MGPSWRMGDPARRTPEKPPPIFTSALMSPLSLLLPLPTVHVNRVVAMTPRAGGRLCRLFGPNPHAQSPGGRGAAAAPPPLVQMRELAEGPHTPQNLQRGWSTGVLGMRRSRRRIRGLGKELREDLGSWRPPPRRGQGMEAGGADP